MLTNEQIIKHFREKWKMDIVPMTDGYKANDFLVVRKGTGETGLDGKEIIKWVVFGITGVEGERVMEQVASTNSLGLALVKVESIGFMLVVESGLKELQEQMDEEEFDAFIERAEKELENCNG